MKHWQRLRTVGCEIAALLLMPLSASCSAGAKAYDVRDPKSPLRLVRTIALPNTAGRIDHMALDRARNHLFIAEYGNGSIDDIDLASGTVVGRISGLREPQGIAWVPRQNEIAVASGDGVVTFYRTADRQQVAAVRLEDDADNLRIDNRNGKVVVGYGSGALAVIDPATHHVVGQMILPAHPEGFELIGARVFVNVPHAHKIVIGDIDRLRVIAALGTGPLTGNYPMASDATGSRIAAAFRLPGTATVMDARSGATIFSASICGDADDLYFYAGRLIVICGTGAVELVDEDGVHGSARVGTRRGARTGVLDAAGGRLFIAVPADSGPASVWELSIH
jgi:hypothetical protein